MFKKNYVKLFTISMLLVIVGIILVTISSLVEPPTDFEEYEDYYRILRYLTAFTRFFTQLGIIMFCLSTFLGAMSDRDLSGEVRRGMVFASGMGILALALLMIFQNLFIGVL
ncbi:MAG: hypothetical protein ACFFCE_15750 [Promethearchaeota archaeon]